MPRCQIPGSGSPRRRPEADPDPRLQRRRLRPEKLRQSSLVGCPSASLRGAARDATRKPAVLRAWASPRCERLERAGGGGMFTAGAESLLHQAREIQDEELKKFCSRVSKLLQKEDLGPDAADALRRLFLIVSATKYNRKLEKTCVDLLQTTLCLPTCPEQLQLLCAAILREMSPCDSLSLCCDHIQNTRQLSLVASVLLAQGDKKQEVRNVGLRVFKVLESRQPEGPSLRPLLPVLSKVTSLAPGTLHQDQTNVLNKRLVDWLRYASVQQGLVHSSGGFFSTPRARQVRLDRLAERPCVWATSTSLACRVPLCLPVLPPALLP